MSEVTDPEKAFELEKHVHEQYAINNNANINSFITFLVSLLAIFATYGYVFVFNTGVFAKGGKLVDIKGAEPLFSLDVLYLVTIVSVIILTFLAILCIQLGYAHRRDHLIVQAIREKLRGKTKGDSIFKHFDAKGKTYCNYLPNFYNLFVHFFFALIILLCCATFCRDFIINYFCISIGSLVIIIISSISLILSQCNRKYYKKYKSLAAELNIKEDKI